MDAIKQLEKEWAPVKNWDDFKAGDTITVHYRISEGNKERTQQYQGIVVQRKGAGSTATFTVRKMSGSVGVERIFPIASPFLEKIEVNKRGQVNRARIFYIRERRGKSARIKEKRMLTGEEAKVPKAAAPKAKKTAAAVAK
ncbi:MAG: 50S ribosomal protein L19 [Bacteroidetes bacterium]|nr:50S ribosomal protein L19 [Bacteroidota bacterium]MBS1945658.1 50S ribosomal protein L19 [Bacteroidota bacterium]